MHAKREWDDIFKTLKAGGGGHGEESVNQVFYTQQSYTSEKKEG